MARLTEDEMRGKRFVGLVLTERQAKSLLMYVRLLTSHGAGRVVAKDLGAVSAKLDRALSRLDKTSKS